MDARVFQWADGVVLTYTRRAEIAHSILRKYAENSLAEWFLARLDEAFEQAEETLSSVINKTRFWDAIENTPLNERQRLVLNRLLDGFEGKITSSKWAKLAKCSQDTASRDIADLIHKNILARNPAGGRSTSYDIVLWDNE